MIGVHKHVAAALALGIAVSALATPSFAQRAEDQMSGSRENALKECNAEAQKVSQHTWADHQIHKYRSCMMQHGEQQAAYYAALKVRVPALALRDAASW
ncbi:MAG TPA: hypothetical protein VKB89_19050 [Xanthobacteraceae bacterium]|nr:hypothetical protein [Xanthobacteraceae bacterium]